MANSYFQFKQFIVHQDKCAMKVTTDGCLFGAWVANEINKVAHPDSFGKQLIINNCLDIGTGTGLLTLLIAQASVSTFDAVEIDKDAFEQASENIAASPWADRIRVIHADAKEFSFQNSYDIIISNPPFYENELTSPDLQKNTAYHDSGLVLTELLQIIKGVLHPEGWFYLLLPYKRLLEVGLLFQKYHLAITHITLVKQSPQHTPFRFFVAGQHTANSETTYTKDELVIRNEKNEYTNEFIDLLKDYYLHL